jgi:uncharacterized protein
MKRIPRRWVPLSFKLQVRRARTGRGVFTHEPILRGSCIIEYTGRELSKKEQERNGRYFFWTGRGTMIDGNIKGNTARFINHSCRPNCEIDIRKQRVYVFAKRNIRAGEELTYDYDTEYFEEYIKPRGCLCDKCSA